MLKFLYPSSLSSRLGSIPIRCLGILSVDIIDFVLLTIYPVGALFIIEIISRVVNRAKQIIPSWIKLYVQ